MKKIRHFIAGIIILGLTMAFVPTASADLNCAAINNPAETAGSIVTVIEEEIGTPALTSTADVTTILQCFRKTTCKAQEGCKSEFFDTCEIGPDVSCQRVQVFVAASGAALLYSYIGLIYKWAAGVIGVVSVLFLVWGGVEIATAGDNTGKIDTAKQRIIQSIAGLVLLFLSAVILYTINPNFFTA